MSPDDDDPATAAYKAAVADIIDNQPRASAWQPAQPVELFVKDRRAVASIDQLDPTELAQLERMAGSKAELERALRDGIEGMPMDLEVARVVDDAGALRYRLYGWNYGVAYLMAAEGLACLAFASQHALEHWSLDQRDLFWAMDRAMQRKDHGFEQPMEFCWADQSCWDEVAEQEPGTIQSEPYIRQKFAGRN